LEFVENIGNHFFNKKLLCTFEVYNKKGTKLSMKHFLNIAMDLQLLKGDERLEDTNKCQRK